MNHSHSCSCGCNHHAIQAPKLPEGMDIMTEYAKIKAKESNLPSALRASLVQYVESKKEK